MEVVNSSGRLSDDIVVSRKYFFDNSRSFFPFFYFELDQVAYGYGISEFLSVQTEFTLNPAMIDFSIMRTVVE